MERYLRAVLSLKDPFDNKSLLHVYEREDGSVKLSLTGNGDPHALSNIHVKVPWPEIWSDTTVDDVLFSIESSTRTLDDIQRVDVPIPKKLTAEDVDDILRLREAVASHSKQFDAVHKTISNILKSLETMSDRITTLYGHVGVIRGKLSAMQELPDAPEHLAPEAADCSLCHGSGENPVHPDDLSAGPCPGCYPDPADDAISTGPNP